MAKRIPPSRRPERQMDEAAKAIAQSREAAKADKPNEPQTPTAAKPSLSRLAKGVTSRKVAAQPVYPSTKRPKKV